MESDNRKGAGAAWLAVVCIILSITLVPIVLSRILWDTSVLTGLSETTGWQVSRLASIAQIFMALPLGLLDLILGFNILLKRPSSKIRVVAIIGIVVGLLGILTGFIWLLLLSGAFGQVY